MQGFATIGPSVSEEMKHLACIIVACIAMAAPVAAASSPPSDMRRSMHSNRILQSSNPTPPPTYSDILAYRNTTIDSNCYVATPLPSQLVVWCDLRVPVGWDVRAEIRDGTCDDFTDVASSASYNRGVASPVYLPEITDEEKRRGTFDHAYCARMDVLYDVDGDGESVSVMDRRFPMEVTYRYEEKVDNSGAVQEELASATLSDEGTQREASNEGLKIGLGVLAGAIVTLALIAIIYGRRKTMSRKRWERMETERMMVESDDQGNGDDGLVDVEIAPMASPSDDNELI